MSRRSTASTPPSTSTSTARRSREKWDRGWPGGSGLVVGFKVDSRQEVDALVAALVADGVPVQQEPFDAFWGAALCGRQRPRRQRRRHHEPGRPGPAQRGTGTRMSAFDEAIDVVIEIPTGSRNKYEYDHDQHVIRLDRRLFTATTIRRTTASSPTRWPATATRSTCSCSWRIRPFRAASCGSASSACSPCATRRAWTQSSSPCLEHDPQWDEAHDIEDVPEHLRNEIAHFFSIYKDLEPEKSTEVEGFHGRERRAGRARGRTPCLSGR